MRKVLGRFLAETANALLSNEDRREMMVNDRIRNLNKLWFVADAPLFVDARLVDQLYDAIFRPEFEVASRTQGHTDGHSEELASEISVAKDISIPTFVKLSATGKIGGKLTSNVGDNRAVTEIAVQSSERKQEQLLNLYVYSYPDRLFFADSSLDKLQDLSGNSLSWNEVDAKLDTPGVRPIIIFDLHDGARIIPMFGELTSGEDVDLYRRFLAEIPHDNARKVPTYPSKRKSSQAEYEMLANEYWSAFFDVFDSQVAMQTIEKSTREGGRFDWIDYRLVQVKPGGTSIPVHLHVVGRGSYPSGTFAYQLVRRGETHGVRIVGTLKKGGDVNVLSIYER
jgi:hypothetical protein